MGARQSVPHIHVHIVPHHCGDLEPRDNIYDQLNHGRQEMSYLRTNQRMLWMTVNDVTELWRRWQKRSCATEVCLHHSVNFLYQSPTLKEKDNIN
ncbi:hypothetical protein ACHAWX_002493 [Stephanocyclus meneghinianus]